MRPSCEIMMRQKGSMEFLSTISKLENHDRKTTIVDTYFSTTIVKILENDPDLKAMAECKTHLVCNKWKVLIPNFGETGNCQVGLLMRRVLE